MARKPFSEMRAILRMKKLILLFAALLVCTARAGDSPLTEPLCMLLQVVARLRECVAAHELGSIHDEDMTLNVAATKLLAEAICMRRRTQTTSRSPRRN
jgi:hypothetical protein